MIEALTKLIRVPAVAPENGGDGEQRKAEKLAEILETVGFDQIEHFDANDSRVYPPDGFRDLSSRSFLLGKRGCHQGGLPEDPDDFAIGIPADEVARSL